VVELVSIEYKDERIELRIRSITPHEESSSLVATVFKFFFDFLLGTQRDIPRATEYVKTYLKPFDGLEAAQTVSIHSERRASARHGGRTWTYSLSTGRVFVPLEASVETL
jgi:hypothetical protein